MKGDQIRDEMSWACSTHGNYTYNILVGKSEWTILLRRQKR